MLHLMHYPREIIAARVVFTPADQAPIALCRGPHKRLGFAYQRGFLHLTGRFPTQQPLEILDDLLVFGPNLAKIETSAKSLLCYLRQWQTLVHVESEGSVRIHVLPLQWR